MTGKDPEMGAVQWMLIAAVVFGSIAVIALTPVALVMLLTEPETTAGALGVGFAILWAFGVMSVAAYILWFWLPRQDFDEDAE